MQWDHYLYQCALLAIDFFTTLYTMPIFMALGPYFFLALFLWPISLYINRNKID